MKKRTIVTAIVSLTLLVSLPAFAMDDLVQSVADGCKQELASYCKDVTPGEGRILACLFAHEDKLSGQCEYALYDAAVQLERAVAALGYVVNECKADIQTLCRGVQAGEGRLDDCLKKNEAKVSDRCKGALQEVGLR